MASLSGGGPAATHDFQLDEGGGVGPATPKLPPTPPFIYRFHPDRWQVMLGCLVPLLGTIKLVDGANGVTIDPRTGRPSLATAKAMSDSQGWLPIPLKTTPDRQSYCVRVAGTGIHTSRWEKTFPGSDKIQSDERGFVRWLMWLREQRHVPHPHSVTIEALIDRTRDHISKLMATGRPVEGTERHTEMVKAEEALAELKRELQWAVERETDGKPAEAEDVDDLDSEEG